MKRAKFNQMMCSLVGSAAKPRRLGKRGRAGVLASAAAAITCSIAGNAHATDFEKAPNTTALNLAGSYLTAGGPPTPADRILVDSAMTANESASVGTGGLSIAGILVDATTTKVLTIKGPDALTLGASGITVASTISTAGLTFSGPALTAGAAQTWDFGTRTATFSGTTSFVNTSLVTLTGSNAQQVFFYNGTSTLDAQITGNLAITLDNQINTGNNLALTNANSTFTGGVAISAGDTVSASSMRAGTAGTASAAGTGTINIKGGAFRYTGLSASTGQLVSFDNRSLDTFEVVNSATSLTISSISVQNNAATTPNGAILGGAGNIVLTGASAALKDSTAATRTPTSLTKFGSGSLELRGTANTFTGALSVSGGTLELSATTNTTAVIGGTGGIAIGSSGSPGGVLKLTYTGALNPNLINNSDVLQLFSSSGTPQVEIAMNFASDSIVETVGGLSIDGVALANGLYGASVVNSAQGYFSGTGEIQVVPEPATLSLAGVAGLTLLRRRRRIAKI